MSDGQVQNQASTGTAYDQIQMIPLDQIIANPHQPRKHFDQDSLEGLASSIRAVGLLQPIVVTKKGEDGKHIIIAGERRYRAMGLAKKKEISAIVRDVSADDVYTLSATENLTRLDMTPLEEAAVYKRFEEKGRDGKPMSHGSIATLFGKDRSHIANMIGLLDLPTYVVDELAKADSPLKMGHARALKGAKEHPELIQTLFDRIMKEGVSVRFVEEQVKEGKAKIAAGASAIEAAQGAADAPKATPAGETHPRTQGDGTIPQGSGNTATGGAPTPEAQKEPEVQTPAELLELQKAMRTALRADVRILPNGSEFQIRVQAFSPSDLARLAKKFGVEDEKLIEAARNLAQ